MSSLTWPAARTAAMLVLALTLASCGGGGGDDGPSVSASSNLPTCLGSQTGGASQRTDDAAFPGLAARATLFVSTFETDSDAGGAFQDAKPTQAYVMADEASAKQAVRAMAHQVTKPEQPSVAERRGNLVLVFSGRPSSSQMRIIDGCLKDDGADRAGASSALLSKTDETADRRSGQTADLAKLRQDPAAEYGLQVQGVFAACAYGSREYRWPAQLRADPAADDDPAGPEELFNEDVRAAGQYPINGGGNDDLPSPAAGTPRSARFEIVAVDKRYDGVGAATYLTSARDGSIAEKRGGVLGSRPADADGLRFDALDDGRGVVTWKTAEHPVDATQRTIIDGCFTQATDRFEQMLAGRRELNDWSK